MLAVVLVGGLAAGIGLLVVPFVCFFAASVAFGQPHNQRALLKEAPEIAHVLSTL